MLAILFLNDGTGNVVEGNYKWKVMINKNVLAKGELKRYDRRGGWQGLVKNFAASLEEDKTQKEEVVSKSVLFRKTSQGVLE